MVFNERHHTVQQVAKPIDISSVSVHTILTDLSGEGLFKMCHKNAYTSADAENG